MTIKCQSCGADVPVKQEHMMPIVRAYGKITGREAKNTGRPVGYRKCPKCGKMHKQEEMLKCKAN